MPATSASGRLNHEIPSVVARMMPSITAALRGVKSEIVIAIIDAYQPRAVLVKLAREECDNHEDSSNRPPACRQCNMSVSGLP